MQEQRLYGKCKFWWPCVPVPRFHLLRVRLLITKLDRTATNPISCTVAKNEKISHTSGRCVQIAWQ
jgi:hypothetical protein